MLIEALLVAGVSALAFRPLADRWADRLPARTVRAGWLVASLAPAVLVAAGLSPWRAPGADHSLPSNRPVEVPRDGYVTSGTCAACHPDQHASWWHSFHRSMTQPATERTVVADFDQQLELQGLRYTLHRDAGAFFVDMDDPDALGGRMAYGADGAPLLDAAVLRPRVTRQVVLVTGLHNKQIYWFSTGSTRDLGQLPVYWLPEDKRWIPRQAGFLNPPERDFQSETGRWSTTCIRCHTTNGRARIRGKGAVDSLVSEFGIACESCHGPGEAHVAANRDPTRRYAGHMGDGADDTIVNPARLSPDRGSQVCGQCHGLYEWPDEQTVDDWNEQGPAYRPGDDLAATRLLVSLDMPRDNPRMAGFLASMPLYMDNRFWSDGSVRVTGREYTSMQRSPCVQRGTMSCFSCHAMHAPDGGAARLAAWADDQLADGMRGDGACLSCHDGFAADPATHGHHAPGPGAPGCLDCHMPYTAYGLLKAVRNHSISSPSAVDVLATGRPDACSLCHLDQPLAFTADALQRWYGIPAPPLDERQRSLAAGARWALSGDAQQRALVTWAMGWKPAQITAGTGWMAPYLAQLLIDPYDAVRYLAHRSLRSLPGYGGFEYDFLGVGTRRLLAQQAVLATWRESQARGPTATGMAVLLDPSGRLEHDVWQHLLGERDDRPIILQE